MSSSVTSAPADRGDPPSRGVTVAQIGSTRRLVVFHDPRDGERRREEWSPVTTEDDLSPTTVTTNTDSEAAREVDGA